MVNLVSKIASELSLQDYQVNNVVKLIFEEECTIPFVARYRKEMTGSMDEVVLRNVRDRYTYLEELETNKVKYLKVVEQHCKKKPELQAKWPELRRSFEACQTKQELEDLYLPFKPKRRTRAQIARERGLEPLVNRIIDHCHEIMNLEAVASQYVTALDANIEPNLRVGTSAEALSGAADILAEIISETALNRSVVRTISYETGVLVAKKIEAALEKPKGEDEEQKSKEEFQEIRKLTSKKKVDASKYENYFEYKEPIVKAAAHRIMAVRRGEAEKILRVGIEVNTDKIYSELKSQVIKNPKITMTVKEWIENVTEDSYRRLLGPSMETELRIQLKGDAEEEAIKVFSKNLENLLLLPPIPRTVVMGVDPGLRTGSKLAVVDETSKYLECATIYPDPRSSDSPKSKQAKEDVLRLVKKYGVNYIAIGNGTGSREIGRLISEALKEEGIKDIKRLTVNEAGASVYSTDEIAREEFPDLDPTIRSAISIARRLQDPLAELVKIDPRSIGVGQYQHDVNVTKLSKSLREVVESCVNRVGVNVNTASYSLLSYVSGINKTLAKNIVALRDSKGKFTNREELLQASGFGPKAYVQSAGFLRVPESSNPLDNSAVHPESYLIVEKMAEDRQMSVSDFIGNRLLIESIPLEKYVTDSIGMPTLKDITDELVKPGRDPREEGTRLHFSDEVCEIEDLRIGMTLPGTVTNVTNFGAFVDIGVHQDGLVHISELTDEFVEDPSKVASVGQVLNVRVIDVDVKKRRISLSCRKERPARAEQKPADKAQGEKRSDNQNNSRRDRPAGHHHKGSGKPPVKSQRENKPQFTVNDLLAKFNKR